MGYGFHSYVKSPEGIFIQTPLTLVISSYIKLISPLVTLVNQVICVNLAMAWA